MATVAVNREQLARDNLGLADRRALRIGPRSGLPADEARSAALIGLAEAIDRWDVAGGPFEPFACRVIDCRIRDAARAWRWHGRGELRAGRTIDGDELLELVPDTLTFEDLSDARTDVLRALAALQHQDRQVVLLHGKLGHPLSTVALMLGLDVDRTKYLWRRSLATMRAHLEG